MFTFGLILAYIIIAVYCTCVVAVWTAGSFPSEQEQITAIAFGLLYGIIWPVALAITIVLGFLYGLVLLFKKMLFRQ
ncbi:hypothetical protein SEA_NICEHOUSE_133 [Rhodococcus phage NiceHouse]|nr:hypothetical protein SEA_NICEHOUSE_133 [Rhodococcus phage NiceHouse]